jgi:hypothetical protein
MRNIIINFHRIWDEMVMQHTPENLAKRSWPCVNIFTRNNGISLDVCGQRGDDFLKAKQKTGTNWD